jgi:hypothetical protein
VIVSTTDLLFNSILSSKTEADIVKCQRRFGEAVQSGTVSDFRDARVLALAIQQQNTYLVFQQMLEELQEVGRAMNPEREVSSEFEAEVSGVKTENLVLLNGLKNRQ